MGQSIAVMNTKGGVGKSTVTMALAETLSVFHAKTVLVIDSDSQTSISIMMTSMPRWEAAEADGRTLVEYLTATVLGGEDADWKQHVLAQVSDVDDAETVYLLPGHMNLTLFEREVSVEQRHGELRKTVRTLLDEASKYFDVILIDCPPGLSVLTECWLREADYYLPPTKADYLSVRGLAILQQFRVQSAQHGFAELLGVLINQKDEQSPSEAAWHRRLIGAVQNRCFPSGIPRRTYIQRAADFDPGERSYLAKYPGDSGAAIRAITAQVMERMAKIAALRRRSDGDAASLEPVIDKLIAEMEPAQPVPEPAIRPRRAQIPAGNDRPRTPTTTGAAAPLEAPTAPPAPDHEIVELSAPVSDDESSATNRAATAAAAAATTLVAKNTGPDSDPATRPANTPPIRPTGEAASSSCEAEIVDLAAPVVRNDPPAAAPPGASDTGSNGHSRVQEHPLREAKPAGQLH